MTVPVRVLTAAPAAQGEAESGVVGTLSPSRASDFMTCPLLYRFRVIDRLPERPSAVATRGTMVHAVLEGLFDLPPSERTLDRAAHLLQPAWERLLEAEPELGGLFEEPPPAEDSAAADTGAFSGWMASAVDLLRCYFTLEDPRRLEPADREVYVETVLDSGLALRGYVDRIDVSPSGDVRVVDYKTGRAPAENFEARALFQMRFYALVVWRLRGVVPRMLQLLYLGSGEVLRYEPDEADLLATERKLLALWAAISRAMKTGDWRPSPSRVCDWCDHRERCPAFGGTPPPLPEQNAAELGQRDGVLDVPTPRSRPDEV
jgi:putative RecB family exonuclease